MTELQCTIAYGAYDSKDIVGAGQSSTGGMLMDKMAEIYFPSTDKDDPRVSHVELFLGRSQKYKYLFNEGDKGIPTIPENLHRLKGKEISIDDDCINQSMLTRKNLSNPIDVSPKTLLRHAKDVEANAKIAFGICTSDSSPYKKFNGTFASGTNWETYIEWVRQEMYKDLVLGSDKVLEINDNDDPDSIQSVSVEDDENENDVVENSNNDGNAKDGKENSEEGDDTVVEATVVPDDEYDVPYDWMFKGFLAFALWGYIPIPGGEKYKSLLMCAIDGDEKDIKDGSRKHCRKRKTERASVDHDLDKRGESKDESHEVDNQLAGLLQKGRLEMQRQKAFQSRVYQLEYQINYEERKMTDDK